MTADDNVLPASDPVARDLLLDLLEGRQDLREAAARPAETVPNAPMPAQADEPCGAGRGERPEDRVNSRNGYRERPLPAAAGEPTPRVPKLRRGPCFPDGPPGRWGRADAALAAAISETYVRGVPARKVEAAAAGLGPGSMPGPRASSMRASPGAEVSEFRTRPPGRRRRRCPWLDATWAKRRADGRGASRAVVAAIALGEDGRRRFCGAGAPDTGSHEGRRGFLRNLRSRGTGGVRLVVPGAHGGLRKAMAGQFQGASRRRRAVHLLRDVRGRVHGRADEAKAAGPAKSVFARPGRVAARAVLDAAAAEIRGFSKGAAACPGEAGDDCPAYMAFPRARWARIRTDNVQERADREVGRRTEAARSFPSRESLVGPVGAVLAEEEGAWARQRVFRPESAREAWGERPARVPTRPGLETAERRARDVVRGALDRAAERA